jgi:type II secretory pathway component PulF
MIRKFAVTLRHYLVSGTSFQDAFLQVSHISELKSLKNSGLSVSPVEFLRHVRALVDRKVSYVLFVTKSSIYPMFLLSACVGVFLLVWTVFLPQLAYLSQDNRGPMVSLFSIIDGVLLVLCCSLIVFGVSSRFVLSFKNSISIEKGVFYWSVGMLCSQGLSLNAVMDHLDSQGAYVEYVQELREHLYSGFGLESYFGRDASMEVGERSCLHDVFFSASDVVFESVERYVARVLSLVNPFLLICVGCVVFALVYSLFVPLLKSFNSI